MLVVSALFGLCTNCAIINSKCIHSILIHPVGIYFIVDSECCLLLLSCVS